MCGLSLYQLCHGVNTLKILQFQVFIANGNLEVLFQEQYELHGKHGTDEARRKNLVLIGNRPASYMSRQERPQFLFRLLHEFPSLQDSILIAVKPAATLAAVQTGIYHLPEQWTGAKLAVFKLVIQHLDRKQDGVQSYEVGGFKRTHLVLEAVLEDIVHHLGRCDLFLY